MSLESGLQGDISVTESQRLFATEFAA